MWPMLQSLWLALSRKLARKAAPGRRPAFRPLRVEALEDRTVPSAASLAAYGQLPLSFEANQGQTAAQVNFLSRGQGYTLFLAPSEAVLALSQGSGGDVLQMQLVGVNSQTPAVGLDQRPGSATTSSATTPASGTPTSPTTPRWSTRTSTPA